MTNDNAVQQLQNEIQRFTQQYPEIEDVDLISMDISGHFFGKRYPIAQLEKLAKTGLKLPRATYLRSSVGTTLTVGKFGFDDGDPDQDFQLVLGSLSKVPWDSTPRAQMLVSTSPTEQPLFFEPRAVLVRVLEEFHNMGYYPTVAFELEYYLIDNQRTSNGLIKPPKVHITGRQDSSALLSIDRIANFSDCNSEIIKSCEAQGIKTGALSAELGPGQYELNLEHQNDVMLAADQCAMFRRTVQAVSQKHGHQATFMAKPYLDAAGNGQHLHLSLYDKDGNNVLQANQDESLRHAIAGSLDLLPASMAILAPNSNAYRRYVSGNCVAVNISWGYENRTTAIRVPDSDSKNRRIEHRVAGADSNPYLILACMLAGIAHGLNVKQEPGAPNEGNACEPGEGNEPSLPSHLRESLELFGNSEPLQKYLGESFVETYCQLKSAELIEFEQEITAREFEWYL